MVTESKDRHPSDLKSQKNVSEQILVDIKKHLNEGVADEPAWQCLTTKPGLYVWRVNKFKLESIETKDHGYFYDGDSYIVLHTYTKMSQKLLYDVYIWIGKHSTADEYGTAAYKMAELDVIVLKDVAIQHRECQSYESSKFMSLFPKFTILKGGVDSGFKSVGKEKAEPKLFHISGDRKSVKEEQISFRKNNLTADDVFIIDLGDEAYQVNGRDSSKEEKFAGAVMLSRIKSERGKVVTEIIDDYCSETKHPVLESMPVKDKANHVKPIIQKREKSLWKLSDEFGKMEMTRVACGKISKQMLLSEDVFILDGVDTIFVWVGKCTSKDEKMYALTYAQKYADIIGEPNIPLVKIFEGNETDQMKSQIK